VIPQEVLKQIRRIHIRTRHIVNDQLVGQYESVFKGQGMEFKEVREYQPGDEIRTIDWNVTARTGHPFVKVFAEERELTVMLIVDVSGSGMFGTRGRIKNELAAELCAVLAFSAVKNNDRVGLIMFTDGVETEKRSTSRSSRHSGSTILRARTARDGYISGARISRTGNHSPVCSISRFRFSGVRLRNCIANRR